MFCNKLSKAERRKVCFIVYFFERIPSRTHIVMLSTLVSRNNRKLKRRSLHVEQLGCCPVTSDKIKRYFEPIDKNSRSVEGNIMIGVCSIWTRLNNAR